MANDENLISMDKRSKSEARELGKKGGIASGKKRRQKAILKEYANQLLQTEVQSKKAQKQLEKLGLDNTWASAVVSSLITKCASGDVKAIAQLIKLTAMKDEYDIAEQEARIEYIKMQTKEKENNINGTENTESKLDKIMETIEDEFKNG